MSIGQCNNTEILKLILVISIMLKEMFCSSDFIMQKKFRIEVKKILG